MTDFKESLYYNPHIWWDPIGPPWETGLDQAGKTQLALIRLGFVKEVLAAQMKAVEAATALMAKTGR
jgi:hypothetical protein